VSSLTEKETTNNEHYNNRSFCPSWITDLCLGVRYAMKETLLQPSDMIEELMYHIMWNEFDGELDPEHKYFPLYLSLQQLLEDETRRLEE
jgi:hypothetical protein